MALVTCPDCQRNVSTLAEDCPGCGRPMAGRQDIVGGRRVRTVERTAKRFKGLIFLSSLALLAGIWGMITKAQTWPIICLVLGLPLLAFGKFMAWWHHG